MFVIYIRDSIALRFEPFRRMYEKWFENRSKFDLSLRLCCYEVFVAAESF